MWGFLPAFWAFSVSTVINIKVGAEIINTEDIVDWEYFKNETDDTRQVCPIGHKCSDETKEPCPSGYYQDEIGQRSCKLCEPGWHQSEPGSTHCIACPLGMYCNTTVMAMPCPAGHMQNQRGSMHCEPCAFGSYQREEASRYCIPCPNGHECTSGASSPQQCTAGSYLVHGRCELCEYGTFQLRNGTTGQCNFCPPGHKCPFRQLAPIPCEAGTFSQGGIMGECVQCPAGTYQDQPGQTICHACPAGSYCSGANTYPVMTEPGYYQPTMGAIDQIQCPVGTYNDEIGAIICKPCPSGHACPVSGQPIRCQAGHYQQGTSRSCGRCGNGDYQPKAGQTTCIVCPAGHECPASYPMISAKPCEPGFYQPQSSETECRECPPGHHCPTSGMIAAIPCRPGTYQSGVISTECTKCEAGFYQPSHGARYCIRCPNGYNCTVAFEEPVKTDVPVSVPTSTTKIFKNLRALCPAGKSILKTAYGQPCATCSQGFFKESVGNHTCTRCSPGTYSGMTGSTGCIPCAAKTFTRSAGSSRCESCWKGYECPTGTSVPLPCPSGTFSDSHEHCTLCPAGSYNLWTHQSVCRDCPAGHFCPNGTSQPLPCPPGTYRQRVGASVCDICQPGHMCPRKMMTAMLPCPAGTYQPAERQQSCSTCLPGTYGFDVTQRSCQRCPSGHKCPGSQPGIEIGPTRPIPCPPHTFQSEYDQPDCVPCPENSFQFKSGQTNCEKCPAGFSCALMLNNIRKPRTPLATSVLNDGSLVDNSIQTTDIKSKATDSNNGDATGDNTVDENDKTQETENTDNDAETDNSVDNPSPPTDMSDDEVDFPIPCRSGTSSASGDVDCKPCAKGHFSESGSDKCAQCGDGQYCPDGGNKKEYACPNGYAVNCHAEESCNRCNPATANGGSGLKRCAEPKCDVKPDSSTSDCLKAQAKCLIDAALTAASGGFYAYVDLAVSGADAVANHVNSKDRQNAVKDAALTASADVAVGYLTDSDANGIPTNRAGRVGGRIAGSISAGREMASLINRYADRSQRDQITRVDVAYSGMKTLDAIASNFDDVGPAKWRHLAGGYKKIGLDGSISQAIRDKLAGYTNRVARAAKYIATKSAEAGRWAAKKFGGKIPLMCNLIEAFSPACRKMINRSRDNTCQNDSARRRRSVLMAQKEPFAEAPLLADLLTYTEPANAWFRENPEFFLLMAGGLGAECAATFRGGWQDSSNKQVREINMSVKEHLLAQCDDLSDGDVDSMFNVNKMVDRFNQLVRAVKVQMDDSLLEPILHAWSGASEALPKNPVDDKQVYVASDIEAEINRVIDQVVVIDSATSPIKQHYNATSYISLPRMPQPYTLGKTVFIRLNITDEECPHLTDVKAYAKDLPENERTVGVLLLDEEDNIFGAPIGYYIEDIFANSLEVQMTYYVSLCSDTGPPSNTSTVLKYSGTIKGVGNRDFNPETQAMAFRKAFKGFGTDEEAIINILCGHTNAQRQMIKQKYWTMYGRDLISDFRDELCCRFLDTILAMMSQPSFPSHFYDADSKIDQNVQRRNERLIKIDKNPPAFFAKLLLDALWFDGTNDDTLIRIVVSRSEIDLEDIKEEFQTRYKKTLAQAVYDDTSFYYQRLLLKIINPTR